MLGLSDRRWRVGFVKGTPGAENAFVSVLVNCIFPPPFCVLGFS